MNTQELDRDTADGSEDGSGHSAVSGATHWDIWRARLRIAFGRFLNRLGMPGAVENFSFNDPLNGLMVTVKVGPSFTCITIDGRDYVFDRITGRFAGTGMTRPC